MNPPLVSIIISCKNEASRIERLLKSIQAQTLNEIELIVVDNFSTDDTRIIAQKYTKQVFLYGPERSSQRNFGARKARSKYLFFLDADMELPKTLVGACVKAMHGNYCAVIIPEIVPGSSFFCRVKRLEKRFYIGETLIEAPRFFLKTAFWGIGGYNEALVAGEDWDIADRIKTQGAVTRIKISLMHHENSFIREFKHKIYYARKINYYAIYYPRNFKFQSGLTRLQLFWRKKRLFTAYPLETVGLLLLKGFEYGLYRLLQFIK